MGRQPPQIELRAEPYRPPTGDPADELIREVWSATQALVEAVEAAKSAAVGKVGEQIAGEALRAMRRIAVSQLRLTALVMVVVVSAWAVVVSGVMWWLLRPTPLAACIEQPSHWMPMRPGPTKGLKS